MYKKGEKSESILNYGLIVMTLTHMLTHIFGGIHLVIFSILRDEFNLSLQQLGIIAAIPPLCQAFFAIPAGIMSDRIGSKKMITISFIVAIIGALLASQTTNTLIFIVAISLIYVNSTIYHPASYSFTTKLFKPKDRPKALGVHGAGATLGHAIGPLSVSIFIGLLAFEWRQVYLILAVPMFLGIIMVLRIKNEPVVDIYEKQIMSNEDKTQGRSLFTKSLVMFLFFSGLRMMVTTMISTFIVLYLQDTKGLSLASAGLVSSGRMLVGLLAAPIGGYFASRFGEKKWLLFAYTLGYLFLGLSMVFSNAIWFIIFYLTSSFCIILGMAARSSIIARLSSSRQRGLGYALSFLPGSIMGVVGPVLAGFIATSFGFDAIFYVSLGIAIISLIILKFTVKID